MRFRDKVLHTVMFPSVFSPVSSLTDQLVSMSTRDDVEDEGDSCSTLRRRLDFAGLFKKIDGDEQSGEQSPVQSPAQDGKVRRVGKRSEREGVRGREKGVRGREGCERKREGLERKKGACEEERGVRGREGCERKRGG